MIYGVYCTDVIVDGERTNSLHKSRICVVCVVGAALPDDIIANSRHAPLSHARTTAQHSINLTFVSMLDFISATSVRYGRLTKWYNKTPTYKSHACNVRSPIWCTFPRLHRRDRHVREDSEYVLITRCRITDKDGSLEAEAHL